MNFIKELIASILKAGASALPSVLLFPLFAIRPVLGESPPIQSAAEIFADLEGSMTDLGYGSKIIKHNSLPKFGGAVAHWNGEVYVSLNPETLGPTLMGFQERGFATAPVDLLDPIFSVAKDYRPSPYPCIELQYLHSSRVRNIPVRINSMHEIAYPGSVSWVGARNIPKTASLDGSLSVGGRTFNYTKNLPMCEGCQANFNALGDYLRHAENVYKPGTRIPLEWSGGARVDYVVKKGLQVIPPSSLIKTPRSQAINLAAPPVVVQEAPSPLLRTRGTALRAVGPLAIISSLIHIAVDVRIQGADEALNRLYQGAVNPFGLPNVFPFQFQKGQMVQTYCPGGV